MSNTQYRVILYCSRSASRLVDRVKADLQSQLALSDQVLETMFSGQPIVMEQSVDHREAERIKAAVEAAGGSCEIEPLSRPRTIDPAGFVERRGEQRRQPGDRRQQSRHGPERRQGDRRRFRRRLRYT